MQAVILAGGKGRRIKPYSLVLPKPLMPIGEEPILALLMQQLRACGVDNVVLCLGHLGELIRAYFESRTDFGLRLLYVTEDEPLGTAGALGIIPEGVLEDSFLMMNGDVLTNLDFTHFFSEHHAADCVASISTYQRAIQIEYGVLEADYRGRMISYTEKPEISYHVSMGIYAFRREILRYVLKKRFLDMPHLMQKLMDDHQTIHTVPFDGEWIDIGNPGEYSRAQDEFATNPEKFIRSTEPRRDSGDLKTST